MTVRWELALIVEVPEGSEPTDTERSLIRHIRWVNDQGPHSSAWHEVMAGLAMRMARHHWAQADLYAGMEHKRAARRRGQRRPG